jgi:hypothetical protein
MRPYMSHQFLEMALSGAGDTDSALSLRVTPGKGQPLEGKTDQEASRPRHVCWPNAVGESNPCCRGKGDGVGGRTIWELIDIRERTLDSWDTPVGILRTPVDFGRVLAVSAAQRAPIGPITEPRFGGSSDYSYWGSLGDVAASTRLITQRSLVQIRPP